MAAVKVLMVGNHPSVKGGITSVIDQLLKHDWTTDRVEMEFIPTYIEADIVKKFVFFMNAYARIHREITEKNPDVVHIHMSYRGSFQRKYIIHKLCRKYHVPDIIHLHGSEFKKWYDESNGKTKKQIRKLLRESSAFIVLGDKWNAAIKSIEPETNTVVVSNAVSVPDKRAEWNENRFQILFLGVLIQRKGIMDLIQAVKILKDSNRIGKLHFVIAGSGAEEQQLKSQVKIFDLNEVIEFAGWTEGRKKEELLKKSQALVLPSYNEGLPVAILEAISYGLPVIATDVGDISSAVREGENGYLIQPGDIVNLTEKILKIADNKTIYEKMSGQSRKIAIEKFSDDYYFSNLLSCYMDSCV